MADELQDQDAPKKGGKLKWIIIVVLILALAGGGYVAYTMFLAPQEEETQKEEMPAEEKPAGELEGAGTLVPMDPFLVNLADPLGRRYLKLGIEVEVRDEQVVADIGMGAAKIKDALLLLLSSKTYEDLSTLESKKKLKMEIVDRLNQVLGKGSVLRIYITDMVIQ